MTDAKLSRLATTLARKVKRDHFGEANAATADELVEYLGVSTDRDLRDVVDYARAELQEPLVSTFSGGYCYPSGYGDDGYKHCRAQRLAIIKANAKAIGDLDRAMERVYGQPQLFGVNA